MTKKEKIKYGVTTVVVLSLLLATGYVYRSYKQDKAKRDNEAKLSEVPKNPYI